MGANRIKTKDKGVEFDTFRKVTMTKKLKIRFVKFEFALAMQILEQVGIFKNTEHVQSVACPEIINKRIYLRGENSEYDTAVGFIYFSDNAERDKYFNNVIKWISEEQFSMGRKLEIGEACLFSDDRKDWHTGKYAGKCAEQLGEPRFLALDGNVSLIRWKYIKPLYGALKIDGDIYTWEMEVSE